MLATLAGYRGSFSGPFVLDDPKAITDNFSIRSFSTAWSPPADSTVSGRPVVNLTLALNYALGGLDVRGYHAFNLAIHVLAALALFGLLRRTLQNSRVAPALASDATFVAGGAALLWALHPLQTESVTYTIQRAESLMGLFYLFTLYAFVRGCRVTSFVACLLGMATKEVMVSAPLVVLLYDRTFVAGNFRDALRARWRYYAALAATWLVLAALVISAHGRGGTAGLGAKIPPLDYALTQCAAIPHYLRLALWPAPLVFDYGRPSVTQWIALLAPAAILLALVGGTLVALRRNPRLGFLGAWFFAILAPSSSVVPVATQTMAEHRMYLSLAAVVALFVLAAHRWLGRRGAVATVMLVATGFVVVTHARNTVYRDELTLWADTAAKAPDNPRAIANLGFALAAAGRADDALRHFETALRQRPDETEIQINYANTLLAARRDDEAIAQLEAALQREPANLAALNNLGIAFGSRGRVAEALPYFERAVQVDPSSLESHTNFALALLQAGRAADSTTQFEIVVRDRPDNAALQNQLGLALAQAGRLEEALRHFETAVKLQPDFTNARENRDRARAQLTAQ